MNADEIAKALRCDVEQGNEGGSRCYREGEDCRDCPNYYEGGDHIMAIDEMMLAAADAIESLQAQLAASQRREKAVLEDLHGYCKACINAPKTLTYDDLIKPICRECNKVVRQNWKWRGPQEAER